MQVGIIQPGNINLNNRPIVRNDDGTVSTVRSISIGTPLGEVLIPTVSDDGRVVSDDEAVRMYEQSGRHLGIFDTPNNATAYAEQLHRQQEAMAMPTVQASTQSNPSTLEQELARRGLSASNQQYRSAPLDFTRWDQASSAGGGSSTAAGVDSSATPNPNAIDPQQAAAFEQMVQESGEQGADSIIDELIALGIGGAGLYSAYRAWKALRSRAAAIDTTDPRTATSGFVGDQPPIYEDPNRPALPSDVTPVDAEFSVVNDPNRAIGIGQRALPSPDTNSAIGTTSASDEAPLTIRQQLEASAGARRRLSPEQARDVASRAARGQPNDVGTIAAEEDLSAYSEEDVRRANSLADELISQRMRGQASGRSRIGGTPTAPVYAPRANEPVENQRPALVNEILRMMREAAQNPAVARALPRIAR